MTYRHLIDAVYRNIGVVLKSELRDVKSLRASLLTLVYWIAANPEHRGILILSNPGFSEGRLQAELEQFRKVFPKDLAHRMYIAVAKGDVAQDIIQGIPFGLDDGFIPWFHELVAESSKRQATRGIFYHVLRILVHQWLLKKGPMTTAWIMKVVGSSYPSVAQALDRLEYCMKRTTDRKVELRYFPRDEWSKLLAVQDEVRHTLRFADRSGRPRSPEMLLNRLRTLDRQDIALGGVLGARHYADIDLLGTPRLDVSVHDKTSGSEVHFVELLDPALKPISQRGEPAALVVHFVRREAPLFESGKDGVLYADPVEVLLDLYDARLSSQAEELFQSFPAAQERKVNG